MLVWLLTFSRVSLARQAPAANALRFSFLPRKWHGALAIGDRDSAGGSLQASALRGRAPERGTTAGRKKRRGRPAAFVLDLKTHKRISRRSDCQSLAKSVNPRPTNLPKTALMLVWAIYADFSAEMSKLAGCADDKRIAGYLKVSMQGALCRRNNIFQRSTKTFHEN